ncbi:cupin domain-containing protein [Phytomonospora endophytica]|uniref:Mannose-6-phosphate isomerase-like protein (Cupin superfamily) n=1 Tax=Phytomonospora endophytica TaxID=714109 RepID=A0A841FVF6_9ACTN|nr:cupin domain-containing protein [Phytomonospora endophytica]MBB6037512.1 mannose-6-phosphate isomerase-like protein (cupin superfamily) [Phytomonospora endophytica]GIG70764.1 hypothetical protein Pen01_70590 [Phytomonospora endophytica]
MYLSLNDAPSHQIGPTVGRNLATPSRGAKDVSVWTLTLQPGPGLPHKLTSEETFVLISGELTAETGGEKFLMSPGDAFIAQADTLFSISNTGDTPAVVTACALPGVQAILADGTLLPPPWAQ